MWDIVPAHLKLGYRVSRLHKAAAWMEKSIEGLTHVMHMGAIFDRESLKTQLCERSDVNGVIYDNKGMSHEYIRDIFQGHLSY